MSYGSDPPLIYDIDPLNMTTLQVYRTHYPSLVDLLPIYCPIFMARLVAKNLLSGNLKQTLQALPTPAEKATLFLDLVITPTLENDDDEPFNILLSVMEERNDVGLTNLAAAIKSSLACVESPSCSMRYDAISTLSDRARQVNIQTHFAVDEDEWPPNQPKTFTPLLLLYYQQEHTLQQETALQVAKAVQSSSINYCNPAPLKCPKLESIESLREMPKNSMTTKQLADVLVSMQHGKSPQFILIEGMPGIGKSFLLKEIAYNWGTNKLLEKFKLVLLVQLRDPAIQEMMNLDDLLRSFCRRDRKAAEIARECSDCLLKNNGEDIVFLLDGFDELAEPFHRNSLIADILNHRVLPSSNIILSSRPHASVLFRNKATIIVDILGFAEEDRKLYIEHSLQEMPQKVRELTKYLEINLSVNGLCFIPINMVILIYLYNHGIPLPRNSTRLYTYFICLTICRHLSKAGNSLDNTITNLTNLPEPCATIIKQLSKFSLKALNKNKLIFTVKDIEKACPGIAGVPGAINGFGLLQAVQHNGLTGTTKTFNFIHFSIQEFLAAYHITLLPPCEQLIVLKTKFWSDLYSNMFAMYMSLTKGQNQAFKQFISEGDSSVMISEKFLKNQLKCLCLFRCFFEAKDCEYYKIIESSNSFSEKKIIHLGNTVLSPNDLECIVLFLNCSSHREWKKLDLSWCPIQDSGFRLLHHGITTGVNVSIKILDLRYSGLTQLSSSLVSDFTIHFGVEVLWISYNYTIGEGHALYDMISDPSSRLKKLYMHNTRLSSTAANVLFVSIAMGKKLQYLDICVNEITDDSSDVIASALEHTSLVQLRMDYNRISEDGAKSIVAALHFNDTLEKLWLPAYRSEDIKREIRSLEAEIINNREIRGCKTPLKIKL